MKVNTLKVGIKEIMSDRRLTLTVKVSAIAKYRILLAKVFVFLAGKCLACEARIALDSSEKAEE